MLTSNRFFSKHTPVQCEIETGKCLNDTIFLKSKTIVSHQGKSIQMICRIHIRVVRIRFKVEQINLQSVTFSVCLFVPYHLENG